jgi:hypothetical protein
MAGARPSVKEWITLQSGISLAPRLVNAVSIPPCGTDFSPSTARKTARLPCGSRRDTAEGHRVQIPRTTPGGVTRGVVGLRRCFRDNTSMAIIGHFAST